LLLLVMALGFVFGRVVIARAYVRTSPSISKSERGAVPAGQNLAASRVAGAVGEIQDESAAPGPRSQNGAEPVVEPEAPLWPAETEAGGGSPDVGANAPAAETEMPIEEVRYAIQVGAFGGEESARRAASQLTRAGYPAKIEVDREHRTFKVVTGRYRTEESAQRALGDVKAEGFPEAFVVAR